MLDEIDRAAEQNRRSRSAEIVIALERHVGLREEVNQPVGLPRVPTPKQFRPDFK